MIHGSLDSSKFPESPCRILILQVFFSAIKISRYAVDKSQVLQLNSRKTSPGSVAASVAAILSGHYGLGAHLPTGVTEPRHQISFNMIG